MKITLSIVSTVAGCGMFCACVSLYLALHGAGQAGISVALFAMLISLISFQLSRIHMRQFRASLSPETRAWLDEYMKETRYREKDRKTKS